MKSTGTKPEKKMEEIKTNRENKEKHVGGEGSGGTGGLKKKRSEGSGGIDGLTNKKRSGEAHSSVGSTTERGGSGVEGLQMAAIQGDAQAQHNLGVMYHQGHDYKKAIEWWEMAAKQGNAYSQYNLGAMYYNGHDYKMAFEWYERAAKQGVAKAQCSLGIMYAQGRGLPSHRMDVNYKKAFEWFEKAAEQGNAQAQYNLGFWYYHGKGVDVNYNKAFQWFEKAAEQGHAKAQYNLGVMYEDGHDYKMAFEWYEKAAKQGHALAQCKLGFMYRNGEGVDVNYKKAFEWYEKAAEQEDVDAQYCLGMMYDGSFGVDVNYKKAFEWYEKAAEQGHPQYQYSLGYMYRIGKCVDVNYKKAIEWLEKAAKQGHADAKYNLGVLYESEDNYKKAIEWYEMAAKQGNAYSQYNLGAMYHNGYGVDVNYKKAIEWYEKAAKQGHEMAQYRVGTMYEHGHGLDVNYKKALEWYKKVAQQGHTEAQYNVKQGPVNAQYRLGFMYHHGKGVEVNYKKAIEWYEKAAKQANELAQYNLGFMYYHGQGVDVNYKKAIEWYEKAAEWEHVDAQYNLGVMYEKGQGVDVDSKKAFEWYEKAGQTCCTCRQGHALAQCKLGFMYRDGEGVDVNYKKAFEWYERAAKQGVADAQCNLGMMYDRGHGVDINYMKAIEWYEKAAAQGVATAQRIEEIKRSGGAHSSVGSTPVGEEEITNKNPKKKVRISEPSGTGSCSSGNVIEDRSSGVGYSKSASLTPEPTGEGYGGSGSGNSLLQRSSTAPCGCYTGQTCPDPECVNSGAKMLRHDLKTTEDLVDFLLPSGSAEILTPPRLRRQIRCPDAPHGGWNYPGYLVVPKLFPNTSAPAVEGDDVSVADLPLSMNNEQVPRVEARKEMLIQCDTFLEQSTSKQDMRPVVSDNSDGRKAIIVADGHGGDSCVSAIAKNTFKYCQIAFTFGPEEAVKTIIEEMKDELDGAMVLVAVIDNRYLTISSYGDCSAWVIVENRTCWCHGKHDQKYAEKITAELTANGIKPVKHGYLHPKPLAGLEIRRGRIVPAFDFSDYKKSRENDPEFENMFFKAGDYVVATPANVGNSGKFSCLSPITNKVPLPFGKDTRIVFTTDGVTDVLHEQDPIFMGELFPIGDLTLCQNIINLVKERANYLYGGKPGDDISGVILDCKWHIPMVQRSRSQLRRSTPNLQEVVAPAIAPGRMYANGCGFSLRSESSGSMSDLDSATDVSSIDTDLTGSRPGTPVGKDL
jgi:TPR repeat protein/serine/threonine protein phosphatase PrpC